MTIEERIKDIEGRLEVLSVVASIPDDFTEEGNVGLDKWYAHDVKYLLSELKRCREALEKYGFHKPECHRYTWDGWDTLEDGTKFSLLSEDFGRDCTCGFTQALHPEGVK